MKLMKALCAAVALAGLAALAVAFARPAYGQGRQLPPGADRLWLQEFALLEGPGSRIGVTARDLDSAEATRLNVQGGVLVETVGPDSPAAKAGLRASDVVVEFDGERVRSLRQFTRLVRETPPDRPVQMAVLRDGRRTELSVTPVAGGSDLRDLTINGRQLRERLDGLTARIPDFNFNLDFDLPGLVPRARLGVAVQELTPDLAAYFGARDGVLVASVTMGSPASRAGLRAGDVIISVNGRGVGSRDDLVREIGAVTGGGEVTLGIVREKQESVLKATIDIAQVLRPARSGRSQKQD
jgi:serine protease Do